MCSCHPILAAVDHFVGRMMVLGREQQKSKDKAFFLLKRAFEEFLCHTGINARSFHTLKNAIESKIGHLGTVCEAKKPGHIYYDSLLFQTHSLKTLDQKISNEKVFSSKAHFGLVERSVFCQC